MDEKKLGTHSIPKLMFTYSIPAMIAIAAFSVYNIADGIFIGRTVGPDGLAAVSISSPVLLLFACISCVVGMGGNALVGIALGEGDRHKASERFSLATAVMMFFIVVLSIVLVIFTKPIALIIGANAAIVDGAGVYLRTTGFFCASFMLAGYLGLSMETAGKPVLAMAGNIIGVAVNLVLDYFFIMRWGMGLFGAALSSGIGASLSCIIFLFAIFSPSSALRFVRTKIDLKLIGHMLYNGLSEGLSALSASVTMLLYNIVIMRRLGEQGLAAYSVIQYCFSFISSVMSGASEGIAPIASYNFGAKRYDRINKALRIYTVANIILAAASVVFMLTNRGWMFRLFSDGTSGLENLSYTISNFYAVTFLFMGLNDIYIAYFTAIADARTSAGLAVFRVLLLKCILVLTLPLLFGNNGIWAVSPVSEFIALCACLFFIKKSMNKNNRLSVMTVVSGLNAGNVTSANEPEREQSQSVL